MSHKIFNELIEVATFIVGLLIITGLIAANTLIFYLAFHWSVLAAIILTYVAGLFQAITGLYFIPRTIINAGWRIFAVVLSPVFGPVLIGFGVQDKLTIYLLTEKK